MTDTRTISIAIPTWNRPDLTIESFYDVYNDERISEIVIVDDASTIENYEDLKSMTDALPKVKLYRNQENVDCYQNKAMAVAYSSNEYCILLDSDNKIDKSYIDTIFEYDWKADTILTPSFAKPHFSFLPYENLIVSKENVADYIDKPMLEVCLNACNFFVNKDAYLKIWDGEVDPVTSDSIYMAYRWLEAGGKIHVVKDLHYLHSVHDGSHYQNNVSRTPKGFHENILQKLIELK